MQLINQNAADTKYKQWFIIVILFQLITYVHFTTVHKQHVNTTTKQILIKRNQIELCNDHKNDHTEFWIL